MSEAGWATDSADVGVSGAGAIIAGSTGAVGLNGGPLAVMGL
jgi:hypothetical protein